MLLGLLGVLRWRRPLGAGLLAASALTGYLFSIPLTANLLNGWVQSYGPLTEQTLREARPGAIVVLAGGLDELAPEYGSPTVHLRTLGRTRYAAHLARRTGLPVLTVGGYAYGDGLPEGELMKDILEREFAVGVPVLSETTSRNTRENARHSAPLLKALGVDTIVLVTNAAHMPRAVESFQRNGFKVLAAPTLFFPSRPEAAKVYSWIPSASAVQQIYYALHEWLGRLWYRWQEFDSPPSGGESGGVRGGR